MGSFWSLEEDEFLISNFKYVPYKEIGNKLNRSFAAVSLRASYLGLRKKNYRVWSKEETSYLSDNYSCMNVSEISSVLGIPKCFIKCKIKSMGLKKKEEDSEKWTKHDISFLKKNYGVLDIKELKKFLGRTRCSIVTKAQKIGISKKAVQRRWLDYEVEYLKNNFYRTSSDIAGVLGRTKSSIDKKIFMLGLRKSTRIDISFIKKEFEKVGWELLSPVYVNGHTKLKYRCDKGHIYWISWNKFQERRRCPKCYYSSDDFFELVKNKCSKLGYTILTEKYQSSKEPLHLCCKNRHVFSMTWNSISQGSRCPQCLCSSKVSKPEKEISGFVRKLLGNKCVFDNVKKPIYPYELDIFIPEKNVAIEYCGLYWHSEQKGKDKNYHKNKFNLCREKNIKLLTIFEDEFSFRKNVVLDRIRKELSVFSEDPTEEKSVPSFTSDCAGFLKNNSLLIDFDGLSFLSFIDSFGDILGAVSYSISDSELNIFSIDSKINTYFFENPYNFNMAIGVLTNCDEISSINYIHDNRWTNRYLSLLEGVGFIDCCTLEPKHYCVFKHKRVTRLRKLEVSDKKVNSIYDCGYSKYSLNIRRLN